MNKKNTATTKNNNNKTQRQNKTHTQIRKTTLDNIGRQERGLL